MEQLVREIVNARVDDVVERSNLDYSPNISKDCGNKIYLKREDMQKIFSFKIRGAYNKIVHLNDAEKRAGVICASAGNHAQGVAYSAKKLGLSATVVMPRTTPPIKVNAVCGYGANVVLHGDNYSEAQEKCDQIIEKSGETFIHPFDDIKVIAGQGRIGLEILEQLPEVDYIFVPIGGGGLMAGVASLVHFFRPEVKVIGVEPDDSNAMYLSLRNQKRIYLNEVGIFADGVAVKQAGELTFRYIQQLQSEIVLVSTDEISSAIKAVYQDTRTIMEPAGALSVAGMLKYIQENNLENKKIAAIASGANLNFERLAYIAERTLVGEKKEILFAIRIPEKPGALKTLLRDVIGERNITEFNYRLKIGEPATVFLGILIEHRKERERFLETLRASGYEFVDLTEDDLAKDHIRHLVGGRVQEKNREKFYRFEFPERPQALMDFLRSMREDWNISLFHYRSHGGYFGRVFVGFEIPEEDETAFQQFLDDLKFHYIAESGNLAVKLFL